MKAIVRTMTEIDGTNQWCDYSKKGGKCIYRRTDEWIMCVQQDRRTYLQQNRRTYLQQYGKTYLQKKTGRHSFSRMDKISRSDRLTRRVCSIKNGRPNYMENEWVMVLEQDAASGFFEGFVTVLIVISCLLSSNQASAWGSFWSIRGEFTCQWESETDWLNGSKKVTLIYCSYTNVWMLGWPFNSYIHRLLLSKLELSIVCNNVCVLGKNNLFFFSWKGWYHATSSSDSRSTTSSGIKVLFLVLLVINIIFL